MPRSRAHAAVDPALYTVSQVVGYIKGKSAIHMARVYGERKRNFVGQHFWARGFFVNTVGRDEEAIALTFATKRKRIRGSNRYGSALKNATFRRAQPQGGAQPPTALSGSHHKAPGFAGGYLLEESPEPSLHERRRNRWAAEGHYQDQEEDDFPQEPVKEESAPQDDDQIAGCEIFGLEMGASERDILAAYHRLMKHVHPDNGGSEFFAKQLNMARDTLISRVLQD